MTALDGLTALEALGASIPGDEWLVNPLTLLQILNACERLGVTISHPEHNHCEIAGVHIYGAPDVPAGKMWPRGWSADEENSDGTGKSLSR